MATQNVSLSEESQKLTVAAARQLAIRRASSVAAASAERKSSSMTSARDIVWNLRQSIEFKVISRTSELEFLELLGIMEEDEIMITLFNLFDEDHNGTVDISELASGLSKMDRNKTVSESLELAMKTAEAFDTDKSGTFDHGEFLQFLHAMMASMRCDINEVAELLVMRVAFTDRGDAIVEDLVAKMMEDDYIEDRAFYDDAIVEVRLRLLFQLIDINGNGMVKFTDVVRRLFRFIESIDPKHETPVSNLLMIEGEHREMDFDEFYTLILNIVSSAPDHVKFNDLANAFTMETCSLNRKMVSNNEMSKFFMGDEMYMAAVEMGYDEEDEAKASDVLEYGRMKRLFDLWDLDHSGTIDFSEMMLGMRKFHEAKGLEMTLEETIATIKQFDTNHDLSLDRKEFAILLVKFSKTVKAELHELIDFMVVQSALKDNDDADKAYVASVKNHAIAEIKEKNRGALRASFTQSVTSWFGKK
mmetsp:Transcript_12828/g.19504  ORF Transcript_12828/g.19504 Transcript_12828/m.19504 type:complete len:474 (-) Transcript_12828:239-1660(-)|eukprot:CAMPEP_0118707628 /NCGR_PEP_ID=MMETSP0800-20121206/21329_1 /TAXON_ID=210618 ORGANISM="Striatella unipunctata, Strain CCMP2910" /NCGR_SAMPLE_ID=MMETSP0800 /ASSEMBLY_ACC=CAM_ASM_000638 /LENGTH=473 /DNA_ID=CAMNT_0006610515 /DNA_START=52 /DNA_END=1473 /DNA_ORIENTATION=-